MEANEDSMVQSELAIPDVGIGGRVGYVVARLELVMISRPEAQDRG